MNCSNCSKIPLRKISSPDDIKQFGIFLKHHYHNFSFINYTGEKLEPASGKADDISTLIFTEYLPDSVDVIFTCANSDRRWRVYGEFYHGSGGEIVPVQ